MAFLERKNSRSELEHLIETWDRLRGWIEPQAGADAPGTDEDFLQLKKEIGQAINVLSTDFGTSALNREAEQAAHRIRQFLAHLPTLESLSHSRQTEHEKLRKAWHGVFLLLSELSGAPEPHAPSLRRSEPAAIAPAVPISGQPRPRATKFVFSRWISRAIYSVFSFVVLLAILSIGFFFAERSGIFGKVSKEGRLLTDTGTILGRIGAGWQSAQDGAARAIPWIYNPIADYYRVHPEISVIAMVGLVGIFVGYLLFIRID